MTVECSVGLSLHRRKEFKFNLKEKHLINYSKLSGKIKKLLWNNVGAGMVSKDSLDMADIYYNEDLLTENNFPDLSRDDLAFEVFPRDPPDIFGLISNMNSRLDSLDSEIVSLKSDNASLKSDNASLKSDNASLETRISSLASDNASLETRVSSLNSRVGFLENFVDPVAKRRLFEMVRNLVWDFKKKKTSNYKTDRWNECVGSLNSKDIKNLHLDSHSDLELTLFSERTKDDFAKARPFNQVDHEAGAIVHDANPVYIASMIKRTNDTRYHALFRCAFRGKSHLDEIFDPPQDELLEEPKAKRQKK